jgi:hypothetical protein
MIIRGASGYGDAFYLWPICDFYMQRGNEVTALCNFPEVMGDIPCKPFDRAAFVDIDCTYTRRKDQPGNVWNDILTEARVPNIQQFRHWHTVYPVCKAKRALIVNPYQPSWCQPVSGFVPAASYFGAVEGELMKRGYSVTNVIGGHNKTLQEWITLYSSHAVIVTQSSSHMVMAEAWGVPCAVIFNAASRESKSWFVKTITPEKVIIYTWRTVGIYDNENVGGAVDRIERIL